MPHDDYARRAARIAAAQLAEAAGFDRVQMSSLDILSDLLLRYISEVGAASHAYAELANRTDANPLDVVQALRDVGVSLAELRTFAAQHADIPFAQAIEPFPQIKIPSGQPTFKEHNEAPPGHIPDFLPALPDLHAYTATERFPQSERNPNTRQEQLIDQQKGGEKALAKLQARLDPTNALLVEAAREKQPEAAAPADGAGVGAQGAQAAAMETNANPFLAAVLWEEDRAGAGPGAPPPASAPAPALQDAAPEPAAGETHWASLADTSTGQAAVAKPFAAWQWTGHLARAARVATSGMGQQEDAYEAGGDSNRQGRRHARGGVAESDRLRVADILAAHGDEGEAAGYGEAYEEMELGREQI